ncbi:MAG: hypothetical protein ACRDG4_01150 [Chloroflexota bacterium]
MIAEVRDELREARRLAESGDMAGVLRTLDRALTELSDRRLLTMEEAAEMLGVKSHEALAPIMHGNGVPLEWRADRPVVALSDVERVAGSEWVLRMQELDRLHDLSSDLGREMTQEEMDALEEGRPGQLPWKREHNRAEQLA